MIQIVANCFLPQLIQLILTKFWDYRVNPPFITSLHPQMKPQTNLRRAKGRVSPPPRPVMGDMMKITPQDSMKHDEGKWKSKTPQCEHILNLRYDKVMASNAKKKKKW